MVGEERASGVNYHIMFFDANQSLAGWRFWGTHSGDTPEAAIKSSKIDSQVALTKLRLYDTSSGLEYERSGWKPK